MVLLFLLSGNKRTDIGGCVVEDMTWEEFRDAHDMNQHQLMLFMSAWILTSLTSQMYIWQEPEKVRSRTDLFATCLMRAFDNALAGKHPSRAKIVELWEASYGVISEFAGRVDHDSIAPFMEPIDLE
jgi:hypothetical protein